MHKAVILYIFCRSLLRIGTGNSQRSFAVASNELRLAKSDYLISQSTRKRKHAGLMVDVCKQNVVKLLEFLQVKEMGLFDILASWLKVRKNQLL